MNLENQLAQIFTYSNENITALNSKLFGGSGNIELTSIINFGSNTADNAPDTSLQPITQVFATGAFLVPPDQSALRTGTQQQLV